MFTHFDPNVKAIFAFLKLLKVKVTHSTVNETLQNHPDWPSLLSVSDALTKWNVANAGGKIEPQDIDQLPLPFLAFLGNPANPFEIITEVTEHEVSYLTRNYHKISKTSKSEFVTRWKGIYLIAEKQVDAGEKDFKAKRRASRIKSIIPLLLLLLLTGFSLLFLSRNIGTTNLPVVGIYLQYLIFLLGIVVSITLLWNEIDSNNPLLHKVCTSIKKGNCDAILSGRQSKVFNWLSWSEVGFFYFAGGMLALLFVRPMSQALTIVAWLNLVALPYTLFSIYYQSRVAKQWCVFCLAVQALLVFGAVNVISYRFVLPLPQIAVHAVATSLLLCLIPVLSWYVIKPGLLRLQESVNTKREYLRLKFNTEIFDSMLQKQRRITVPTNGLGIDLGNRNATNQLVKACSPYCGPCARAHPKIEKLLDEIPNLKAKIIFTTPNDSENRAFNPTSHLLTVADECCDEKELKQALDDWYLSKKKDYNRFAEMHPITSSLGVQGEAIEKMYQWCMDMEISYTPTIFINGYELPVAWDIDDLSYFLLE